MEKGKDFDELEWYKNNYLGPICRFELGKLLKDLLGLFHESNVYKTLRPTTPSSTPAVASSSSFSVKTPVKANSSKSSSFQQEGIDFNSNGTPYNDFGTSRKPSGKQSLVLCQSYNVSNEFMNGYLVINGVYINKIEINLSLSKWLHYYYVHLPSGLHSTFVVKYNSLALIPDQFIYVRNELEYMLELLNTTVSYESNSCFSLNFIYILNTWKNSLVVLLKICNANTLESEKKSLLILPQMTTPCLPSEMSLRISIEREYLSLTCIWNLTQDSSSHQAQSSAGPSLLASGAFRRQSQGFYSFLKSSSSSLTFQHQKLKSGEKDLASPSSGPGSALGSAAANNFATSTTGSTSNPLSGSSNNVSSGGSTASLNSGASSQRSQMETNVRIYVPFFLEFYKKIEALKFYIEHLLDPLNHLKATATNI